MKQAYWVNPYLCELETEIVASADGDSPRVSLADTILYPEGGGQPGDRGWIEDIAVVDTIQREGRAVHLLEAPLAATGPVRVRLDWRRRFDHMQQHTAQHLLTAIADDRHGWATTAFHLGVSVSDIELTVPGLTSEQLADLEEEVTTEIRAGRPVSQRWLEGSSGPGMNIRCRGLPDGFSGELRVIEIEGIDQAACGGTHLHSTAEIETVALLGTEPMRGGTRVFFVAGGRVRRRMAVHEARNAELRSLLGTADDELAGIVANRLEQIRRLGKRDKMLVGELAAALAGRLALSEEPVSHLHLPGHGPELLQQLARRFVAGTGGRLALLTGDGFFVLASRDTELDLARLGTEVAEILDGRGGGKGQLFQGKAAAVDNHPQALAHLCRRVHTG